MSFFDNLFGNNSDAFQKYSNSMKDIAGTYDPYTTTGENALNSSYSQYQNLLSNPNFVQDMVASGFYTSPYQEQLLDRTTKSMNINAANTGMLGSGAANRALQDELVNQTGQFENQYIDRGMNSYNEGLQGMNDFSHLGFNSLNQQANYMGQAAGGQLQADRADANFWPSVIGSTVGLVSGLGAIPTGGGSTMAGSMLSHYFPSSGYSTANRNPNQSIVNLG